MAESNDDVSPSKRLKLEERIPSVLELYKRNPHAIERLKSSMDALSVQTSSLCMVKIRNCNGSSPVPFSNVFCETDRHCDNGDHDSSENTIFFSFKSVFHKGWKLLSAYIEDPLYEPSDADAKAALCKLLTFLLDYNETESLLASGKKRSVTETEWCTSVIHHYLSKLATHPKYQLNNHYRFEGEFGKCSCGCNQIIHGEYGNTSIGNEDTWHGHVDILMGRESGPTHPVIVTATAPVSLEGLNASKVKADVAGRQQLIGQAIVFSHLQRQRHPEYKNCLIPVIGVSKQDIVFFFYDAKHDILLESPPFSLEHGNAREPNLNLFTVLATWLVLNYKLFCSGVTTDMVDMDYKADFQKHAGDKIDIYNNELRYGCFVTKLSNPYFKPWTYARGNICIGQSADEET